MLYFAYGSNMLTTRLEERLGKVEVVGPANLMQHRFEVNKISADGSLKADAFFTGNLDDIVCGVLFAIPPDKLGILNEFEGCGRGYEIKEVEVSLVHSLELVTAFTYYATARNREGTNRPYSWYMRLILAGAEEHQLPDEYQRRLAEIDCKVDPKPGREQERLAILRK